MGGLLGPGPTGLLHAKSAFSVTEKTFGFGFKLRRPPAAETSSQAAVPTEPEAAQSILGHMASLGLGELGMLFDPEPRGIGAEVCSPSTVSLCRMQLLEARFLPFKS